MRTVPDLGDKYKTLQGLVRLLGLEDAVALCNAYAGLLVYVPIRAPVEHPLRQLLSPAAWQALHGAYGGVRVDVPSAEPVLRAARNAELRARRAAGASVRELAVAYSLTPRRVSQNLREGGANVC